MWITEHYSIAFYSMGTLLIGNSVCHRGDRCISWLRYCHTMLSHDTKSQVPCHGSGQCSLASEIGITIEFDHLYLKKFCLHWQYNPQHTSLTAVLSIFHWEHAVFIILHWQQSSAYIIARVPYTQNSISNKWLFVAWCICISGQF